jgi:hypothetical protein
MARLKVALLTTPDGSFVVHHLVKRLDVAGILVDTGSWGSAKKPNRKTTLQKIEHYWMREGPRGALRAVLRKLLGGGPPAKWTAAAAIEAAYLDCLDEELAGGGFMHRRTDFKQFPTFAEIGEFYGIPVVEVGNINDAAGEATLRAWAPDLGVICGGRIVKPHVIAIPRLGLINKHSAILPRHRGLAAEYWCLYYEDFEHLGVTVHFVEPALDNGNILVQERLLFEKGDTPQTLRFKSEVIGREALVKAVRMIEETGTRGTPQDESKATRNRAPSVETDRELYSRLPSLWQRYGA